MITVQKLGCSSYAETVKGILFSLCDVKAKRRSGGKKKKRRGLWLFDVTFRIKIIL